MNQVTQAVVGAKSTVLFPSDRSNRCGLVLATVSRLFIRCLLQPWEILQQQTGAHLTFGAGMELAMGRTGRWRALACGAGASPLS